MNVSLKLYLLNKLNKIYMQASGEHNIILFKEFNKFSNEPAWI